MVFFDLESASNVLYKLEAAKIECGSIKRYFCVFTNCEISDRLREITGITEEQTESGVTEEEAVARFMAFLQECGAVGKCREVYGGVEFLTVECAGFGVCAQLQKILFRYGIRIAFLKKQFCGDLYLYAKTYCNHLPVKSLRLYSLCKHFGIKSTGLQSLYFLSEKLQEERYKNIDAEQYEILRKKLLSEAEKRDFLPKISDRVSADLAKMLLFDAGAFRCTTIKLYENTKNRDHAADDWRRVISGTEKEVVARKSEEGKILFEKNLPENLYIVYPPELTYRILDGEGRVGGEPDRNFL